MTQFRYIETDALIELLAKYTQKFTQLFRFYGIRPNREYLQCKYTIEAIINELDRRNEAEQKEKFITEYESVCLSQRTFNHVPKRSA
jgi:hypothetical protein